MKTDHKKYITIILIFAVILSFSFSAYAQEAKKGFFVRLWEKVSARFKKEAKEVKAPEQEPKVMVPETLEPEMEVTFEEEEIIEPERIEIKEEVEELKEKKETERKKEERPAPPSRERMLEVIKRRLEVYPIIIDIVPGLSMRESADGEATYYFADKDGVSIKLDLLDDKTLYRLYVKVNNEATRIHTERILRQIQQHEQLMRRIPTVPQQPPQPPPQPPRTPTQYQPPKVPQPPPSVPERR